MSVKSKISITLCRTCLYAAMALFGCSLFDDDESFDEGVQIPGTEVFLPLSFHSENIQSNVSPDGQTIILTNYYNDSIPSGIYTLDLSAYKRHLLVEGHGLGSPNWSPDGQWVVFDGGGNIYKIQPDGDSLTQLTFNGSNFHADWSPDGEWIAFDRSTTDDNGPSGIWVMRADGSSKLRIFGAIFPSWLFDSKRIIAVKSSLTGRGTKFVVFNTATNALEDSIETLSDKDNFNPQYSPNGERIVFSNYSGGIWVVNSDGTGLRNILQQTSNLRVELPTWHPDSKHIVYSHFRITKAKSSQVGPQTEGYLSLYSVRVK